jgi:hypothetical protein
MEASFLEKSYFYILCIDMPIPIDTPTMRIYGVEKIVNGRDASNGLTTTFTITFVICSSTI